MNGRKLTNLELQAARNVAARRKAVKEGWLVNINGATKRTRGRPPKVVADIQHGTEASYKWEMRHLGEACEVCRSGRNKVERDRRAMVRHREGSVELEQRAEAYETSKGRGR